MKRAFLVGAFVLVLLASFLLGRRGSHTTQAKSVGSSSAQRILYYFDPMHPAYRSDKPGIAPDCGMDLVPAFAEEPHLSQAVYAPGTVKISVQQQRLIGMRTVKIVRTAATDDLRVLGTVAADDARISVIRSGVSGWMQETMDDSVGSHVKKDQTLATYYSPDFIALEQAYLVATERTVGTSNQQIVQTTAIRLRDYGMGERQIAEIAAKHQVPKNVEVVAPDDAFILSRNTNSGQRFEKGTDLYRLVDLSRVWIIADVIAAEAQYFHPGMRATISVPGQNRTLQARVSNVPPQFDPASGMTKVRLEADNPGAILRLDMFVHLNVAANVPAGLNVPLDALVDSGTEQRVYVDVGDAGFEPRVVTTGRRFGDSVEILSGLKSGETVVVAGTFLIDSESRLKNVRADTSTPVLTQQF